MLVFSSGSMYHCQSQVSLSGPGNINGDSGVQRAGASSHNLGLTRHSLILT